MRAPQTIEEVQVATFVDAFPGNDLDTIAYGLALERRVVVRAMLPLATAGIIAGEVEPCAHKYTERFYPTGVWSPEWE